MTAMRIKKTFYVLIVCTLFLVGVLIMSACRSEEYEVPEETPFPTLPGPTPEIVEYNFSPENFPRVDSSLSTIPLAQALSSFIFEQPLDDLLMLRSSGRTAQAFRNLVSGEADIILTTAPSYELQNELSDRNFIYEMTPIATDALVFVVSASNPVSDLTGQQLRDIFAGQITSWSQVGGNDIEITAFMRNEEAGTQSLLSYLVMDGMPLADAPIAYFPSFSWDEEVMTAIRGFDGSDGAIGFTMLYAAETMQLAEGYKILSIDGIKPTSYSIRDGTYPFLTAYYAVINADEHDAGPARQLKRWLLDTPGQEYIASMGYIPVSDIHVSTDSSDLQFFKFQRLDDAPLPTFTSSSAHNIILPYSSAVTMLDGSMRITQYGFVTIDGVVVTDLIYDRIERARNNLSPTLEPRPAFHLHIGIDNAISESDDYIDIAGQTTLQAAAGFDGSWVTSFVDYIEIVFTDTVVVLVRSTDSFDIDIYDYDGNRLFSILELDWVSSISEDAWPDLLIHSISEGYGFIELYDGTIGVVNFHTGELRNTDFVDALRFSEGLAAVSPSDANGLWGFVNTELEMVIAPTFSSQSAFLGQLAVVEMPDGSQNIINHAGESLFYVSADYFIVLNTDGIGFSVNLREGWDFPVFYSDTFDKIQIPAGATQIGPESSITYLGGGAHSMLSEEGLWVFGIDFEYLLPSGHEIVELEGDYLIISVSDFDLGIKNFGVMTLYGRYIIEPTNVASITAVVNSGHVRGFILNTLSIYDEYIHEEYTTGLFRLLDIDGVEIMYGLGLLTYDDFSGLLFAQGPFSSSWFNISGDIIASIPFLGYSFD